MSKNQINKEFREMFNDQKNRLVLIDGLQPKCEYYFNIEDWDIILCYCSKSGIFSISRYSEYKTLSDMKFFDKFYILGIADFNENIIACTSKLQDCQIVKSQSFYIDDIHFARRVEQILLIYGIEKELSIIEDEDFDHDPLDPERQIVFTYVTHSKLNINILMQQEDLIEFLKEMNYELHEELSEIEL
jgi:hypothetical protein